MNNKENLTVVKHNLYECPLCGNNGGMIVLSDTNELQCGNCGNIFTLDAFEHDDILDNPEYIEPLCSLHHEQVVHYVDQDS